MSIETRKYTPEQKKRNAEKRSRERIKNRLKLVLEYIEKNNFTCRPFFLSEIRLVNYNLTVEEIKDALRYGIEIGHIVYDDKTLQYSLHESLKKIKPEVLFGGKPFNPHDVPSEPDL